jgi:hypothetical protein
VGIIKARVDTVPVSSAEIKALRVELKKQKLSAIKEYEESAENMGYDYVNNALLIGKDYSLFSRQIDDMKSNSHSVQNFKNVVKGATIHEMGHAFHKQHLSEFAGLLKDMMIWINTRLQKGLCLSLKKMLQKPSLYTILAK